MLSIYLSMMCLTHDGGNSSTSSRQGHLREGVSLNVVTTHMKELIRYDCRLGLGASGTIEWGGGGFLVASALFKEGHLSMQSVLSTIAFG